MQVAVTGTLTLPDARSTALVHTDIYQLLPDERSVVVQPHAATCTIILPALDGTTDPDTQEPITPPVAEAHAILIRADQLPASGYILLQVADPAHGTDYINTYLAARLTQAGREYRLTALPRIHRWSLSDEAGVDPQ